MTPAGGISRIHQISMRAHDLERAVRFYRDALGLPFLFAAPPRLAFFDCDGVRLMLSTPEPGFDHPGSVLYFAVDDIQHMRDALTSRGIEAVSIHSHLLEETPRLFFMHFWANDDATKLATGLRAALDATKSQKPATR